MKSRRTLYVVIGIVPAVASVLTLGIALSIVRAFRIPTSSMENTLLIGDRLFVQLFPRPVPKRGDIVAFRAPNDLTQTNIKRVVAIPGDRLKIIRKQLYVNGIALQEAYVIHKTDYMDS